MYAFYTRRRVPLISLLALLLGFTFVFENHALARCRILAVDDSAINLLILKRLFCKDPELATCELVTASSFMKGRDEILLSALKANSGTSWTKRINGMIVRLRRNMTEDEKSLKLKPFDVMLLDFELDSHYRGSTLAALTRFLVFRKTPYIIGISAQRENNLKIQASGAHTSFLKGSHDFGAKVISTIKERLASEPMEFSQDLESEEDTNSVPTGM